MLQHSNDDEPKQLIMAHSPRSAKLLATPPPLLCTTVGIISLPSPPLNHTGLVVFCAKYYKILCFSFPPISHFVCVCVLPDFRRRIELSEFHAFIILVVRFDRFIFLLLLLLLCLSRSLSPNFASCNTAFYAR